MEYSTRRDGNSLVAALRGSLKFSDNSSLRSIIEEMKTSGAGSVTVDLAGLESIDSAGLGMLLLVNDAAKDNGQSLTVAGAQGQVRKMLDISKFGDLINLSN